MPPILLVTSSEQKEEEVAFQIINKDNFPMVIVGQPLKPFDNDAQKSKPNVVVHPTRRITNKVEDNNQFSTVLLNNSNDEIRNNINHFHGNLCHNNSTCNMKLEDFKEELDVKKFSKTLDSKLRRLQKSEIKQQKYCNCDQSTMKKPFVTTVKKGQFLEPPPEIATLMGIKFVESNIAGKSPKEIKKLYAFSSQPRILSRTPPRTTHQKRCEAAAAAKLVGTVVGIKQDNEKLRENVKCFPPLGKRKLKENNSTRTDIQVNQSISTTRVEQAKRRSLARTRAIHQHIKRPKYHRHALCAASDHLQNKLMDLSDLQQLLATKSISDATTQTDLQNTLVNNSKELGTTDVQIQVHPTDLFDLRTEVQSIVEILVTKTIEEALIEVLEEEELMTMKEQQRRFLEYMVSKSSEDSLENDHGCSDEKVVRYSRNIFLNSYVPHLITSV